ncbi:MAG: hypothetical protein K2O40_04905 [Lachnospiraceae bacterium]|nr:hypothetical protein [Lachnospiraceae bacterium]
MDDTAPTRVACQETVINLNADEDEASVYTANPAWIRKMDKLCKQFPEVIRIKSWTEVSKTYVLPKNLVRIGKPRTLSEAQLRHLQELQKKYRISRTVDLNI